MKNIHLSTKIGYEDPRKFIDYSADGERIAWKIKKEKYELRVNSNKTDFLPLEGGIDENEDTGELTWSGITIPFCPRGWLVGTIWAAVAVLAFAVKRDNPGFAVTIYDLV